MTRKHSLLIKNVSIESISDHESLNAIPCNTECNRDIENASEQIVLCNDKDHNESLFYDSNESIIYSSD